MTHGQLRVLREYARCGSQQAVAERFGVSTQTVKNQLRDAYNSLGVRGHIDAFRVMGWLTPPEDGR
jgi:DNA-binding NarL/FixJ family response regulator